MEKDKGGLNVEYDDSLNPVRLTARGSSIRGLLGQQGGGIEDSPLAANPDTYQPRAEGGLLSVAVPQESRGEYGNFFLTNRPENKPMLENQFNIHPDYTAQIKASEPLPASAPMDNATERTQFIQFAISKGKDPVEAGKVADAMGLKIEKKSGVSTKTEEWSQALYGKSFSDLDTEEKQTALKRSQTMQRLLAPAKAQELGSKQNQLDVYDALEKSFDDKYAGKVMFGPTGTEIRSRIGGDENRVNWWKTFKSIDAKLRHELFGATLTSNEQRAWDSITVNENSTPKTIKTAIQTRVQLAKNAFSRELKSYEKVGYDVSDFSNIEPAGEITPTEQATPQKTTNAPSVGTVSKGYVFKGGDPSKKESWVKQNE